MGGYRKLSQVVYRCEYHIVFAPKYRLWILTGAIAELVKRHPDAVRVAGGGDDGAFSAGGSRATGVFGATEDVDFGVHGAAEGEAGDQAIQELPEAEAEVVGRIVRHVSNARVQTHVPLLTYERLRAMPVRCISPTCP